MAHTSYVFFAKKSYDIRRERLSLGLVLLRIEIDDLIPV